MPGRLNTALLFLVLTSGVANAESGAIKSAVPLAVEEPRDIVAAIYEKTKAELKTKSPTSPFYMQSMREKYFTKSFDVLVTTAETKAAHDHDAALDFDPIVSGQDAEIGKVTLKTDLIENGKAAVSASFVNLGQPTIVAYDFLKEEGVWKINDIKGTTEKEAWSVRKILTSRGKEPKTLPGMKDAAEKPDATKKVPTPPARPEQ